MGRFYGMLKGDRDKPQHEVHQSGSGLVADVGIVGIRRKSIRVEVWEQDGINMLSIDVEEGTQPSKSLYHGRLSDV